MSPSRSMSTVAPAQTSPSIQQVMPMIASTHKIVHPGETRVNG